MNLAVAYEVFSGGPGSGCRGSSCGRKKVFYHGTSVRVGKKALAEGLTPHWAGDLVAPEGEKYVYLTTNKATAHDYGSQGGNRVPYSILEIHVPEEKAKQFSKDFYELRTWRSSKSIPKSWIKSVSKVGFDGKETRLK